MTAGAPDLWEGIRAVRALQRQAEPLRRVPREGPLPLSFAQQRLWFLHQLDPASPTYNEHVARRLRGPLDHAALARSLGEVVRRHEVLRTTFTAAVGAPRQAIAAPEPFSLPVVDLRHVPEGEREARASLIVADEVRRPFDLAARPPLRGLLVRTGDADHVLLLVLHHVATDGWSMGVLGRELALLYAAFSAGGAPTLAEPSLQYADFAAWQRRWLRGPVLDTLLAHWRRRLGDGPPLVGLPGDRARRSGAVARGAHHRFAWPRSLGEALEAMGRREGASLYAVLVAGLAVLVHRCTDQEDVVLGTTVANRNRRELRSMLGFFANTLALRADLSGDPTFRELLGRVRAEVAAAYAHQDLPFDRLVEELRPARDPGSASPLFRVMLVLQNFPEPSFALAGLETRRLDVEPGTTKFDLTLSIARTDEGRRGTAEYDAGLFDPATVARLVGHLRTLLEHAAADPGRRTGALPVLTPPERRQLAAWNDTASGYPAAACVHEVFQERAVRAPGAVAVEFDGEQLTYGELNRRANRVAGRLRRLGVGPGALAGICVERSPEMVVGFLAVLKAGGAYLPLDPVHPPERLRQMLLDASPRVLLTQRRLAGRLPDHAAPVLCLDDAGEFAGEGEADRPSEATAEDLAYVMYTSGSTGQPKGICVPHRAVNRLVLDTNYVQVLASDRVAQASNASFDAATFEVWGALLNGARLVGVARDVLLSPADLAARLRDLRIGVAFLTTAVFNQVARDVPGAFGCLRQLMFGGEAVEPRWVRAVLAAGPPERLLHVYGATEDTTFSAWHLVREVPEGASGVPIGRPVASTRIHVLDRRLRPLPVGVPGEICIGGDGLARGYLGRPGLTGERFVPDPHAGLPGARMYRTGDLARRLPDGGLEFLGRLDQQVKIRGQRIEPGEVEAVLARHPGVRQAAVVPREDGPGTRRLVAYVVPGGGEPTAAGDLRAFLLERLPGFMVPAAFVLLDALPLTANGKVDRRALPSPEQVGPEPREGSGAPATALERTVAAVWREALGVEAVGVHDNFFDLGGHSLLLAEVQARLHQALGRDVRIVDLFEHATVSSLARHLAGQAGPAGPGRRLRERAARQREAAGQRRLAHEAAEGP
jgi:amino acid adenylation domain-containing protein